MPRSPRRRRPDSRSRVDRRARFIGTIVIVYLFANVAPLRAQAVEISPFVGYRFGGDLFEIVAARPLDVDGAPTLGVIVDVPIDRDFQFEGLFTHQDATAVVPIQSFGPPARYRFTVDHVQGGALQEFGYGRLRPFLTGMLGLTRYAAPGDSEIRFTMGAGVGGKLFPVSHFGVRLDGRVYATFVNTDARALACVGAGCVVALNLDVVWQIEFTAAMVVKLR